jgi:hypothetical protein
VPRRSFRGSYDGALMWETFQVLGVVPVSFGFLVRPLLPVHLVRTTSDTLDVAMASTVALGDVVGILHETKKMKVAGGFL